MWSRSLLGITCALACGCARGTEQHTGPTPDGSNGPHPDASGSVDAAQDIDAPSGACAMPFSGVLATWTFTGQPGNQASTPSSSTAPGVTAGAVQRSSGLTAVSGSGSINSSNWSLTAMADTTKYYTFTVTPPSGCAMDLTMLSIDAKSSSTGPTMAQVGTSADTYGQTSMVATSTASTPALSVSGASGMIELRVSGFSASGAAGTMRVQNTLKITGSLH